MNRYEEVEMEIISFSSDDVITVYDSFTPGNYDFPADCPNHKG